MPKFDLIYIIRNTECKIATKLYWRGSLRVTCFEGYFNLYLIIKHLGE